MIKNMEIETACASAARVTYNVIICSTRITIDEYYVCVIWGASYPTISITRRQHVLI